MGILGQVWYLIVLIPDLCTITYYATWLLSEKKKNDLLTPVVMGMYKGKTFAIMLLYTSFPLIWYAT